MKRIMASLIVIALGLAPAFSTADAGTLAGQVLKVFDGDTICVRASRKATDPLLRTAKRCRGLDAAGHSATGYRIRLQGIDAPEEAQPFGDLSRANLTLLLSRKTVTVEYSKLDKLRRPVGKITLRGRDVCLAQVKSGMAWYYRAFANELSRADRKLYADAEARAREARAGLWSQAQPVPPWQVRHSGRGASSPPAKGPVVGNRRSHIYQWQGCPYFDRISPANRVPFASAKAAEAAGYRAARNCR